MQMLLDEGMSVNWPAEDWGPPLHMFLRTGKEAAVVSHDRAVDVVAILLSLRHDWNLPPDCVDQLVMEAKSLAMHNHWMHRGALNQHPPTWLPAAACRRWSVLCLTCWWRQEQMSTRRTVRA
jgi:hypothetical protein